MNTLRKGQSNELKVQKIFKSYGFEVARAKITKFNKNDFFGLFDMICIRQGIKYWIQVKTNTKPNFQPFIDWYNNQFADKSGYSFTTSDYVVVVVVHDSGLMDFYVIRELTFRFVCYNFDQFKDKFLEGEK